MALTVTATDTELQKPVNVVFQQTFLRRAQQMCPYFLGTMPGQINRQMGTSTIKWRRIEQETPSTAALSELTGASTYMQGRDADTPTFTDVLATLSKYGQFYIVNEEVDLYNPNGTTDELVAVLGESAGRSLNQLMRDIMEDNATKRYAGNVASDGVVDAAVTVGDFDRIVNELTKNSARMFSPMSNGSINIGTVPILPGYWGLCHPDVAYDIAKLTGFVSVEKYAGHVAVAQGEFGLYSIAGRSIRFIQSEDAGSDPNAGNNLSTTDLRTTSSSLVDLYTTVVYGKDAFGSVGLGKRHTDGSYFAGENTEGFEIIFHPRGSGGISDPFNEIATLAWKAFFAGAVLNANWSRALRTGATNLTN
jgi:N4-gp56 family major capsid protein